MIVRLALWLLRSKRLSVKDKTLVVNTLLEGIKAIPLRSLITQSENGTILVQGRPLAADELIGLRESAVSAVHSKARQLVQNQVRFAAIDKGYLKSYNQDDALFYKAALWFAQEENALLEWLGGNVRPEDVDK